MANIKAELDDRSCDLCDCLLCPSPYLSRQQLRARFGIPVRFCHSLSNHSMFFCTPSVRHAVIAAFLCFAPAASTFKMLLRSSLARPRLALRFILFRNFFSTNFVIIGAQLAVWTLN